MESSVSSKHVASEPPGGHHPPARQPRFPLALHRTNRSPPRRDAHRDGADLADLQDQRLQPRRRRGRRRGRDRHRRRTPGRRHPRRPLRPAPDPPLRTGARSPGVLGALGERAPRRAAAVVPVRRRRPRHLPRRTQHPRVVRGRPVPRRPGERRQRLGAQRAHGPAHERGRSGARGRGDRRGRHRVVLRPERARLRGVRRGDAVRGAHASRSWGRGADGHAFAQGRVHVRAAQQGRGRRAPHRHHADAVRVPEGPVSGSGDRAVPRRGGGVRAAVRPRPESVRSSRRR